MVEVAVHVCKPGGPKLAMYGPSADGSLAQEQFDVLGTAEIPVSEVNRRGLVITLTEAQQAFVMEDQAHEIVVYVTERGVLDEVARRLHELPELEGLEIKTWKEISPQLEQIVGMMDWSVLFILVFVFIAAVAGVANTMLMATFERVREFGMLLSLGCRPGRIVRMILAEGMALGLLGAAIGTALGYAFVLPASHTGLNMAVLGGEAASDLTFQGLRLPLVAYPWLGAKDVLLGIGAVIFTSVVSSVWPAAHAARLEPVEALQR